MVRGLARGCCDASFRLLSLAFSMCCQQTGGHEAKELWSNQSLTLSSPIFRIGHYATIFHLEKEMRTIVVLARWAI